MQHIKRNTPHSPHTEQLDRLHREGHTTSNALSITGPAIHQFSDGGGSAQAPSNHDHTTRTDKSAERVPTTFREGVERWGAEAAAVALSLLAFKDRHYMPLLEDPAKPFSKYFSQEELADLHQIVYEQKDAPTKNSLNQPLWKAWYTAGLKLEFRRRGWQLQ